MEQMDEKEHVNVHADRIGRMGLQRQNGGGPIGQTLA